MGIYDRDYYREQQQGLTLRAPSSIVVALILINVVVYLADALLKGEGAPFGPLTRMLAATSDTFGHPWMWWQYLTYGFLHAASPWHIFFNMLQLWFLGRAVEQHYGRGEFLRIYLVMLLAGGVVWGAGNALLEPRPAMLVGASGAVTGIVMLFVLNFPRQTLILFPIPIPIKAWVIGVALVVMNVLGASEMTAMSGNTAYGVHLSGIAFAYVYHQLGWNLRWLGGMGLRLPRLKRRPKLRIHDPGGEEMGSSEEVDRILRKIHHEGMDSLTKKERRTLEAASRKGQKQQRG